MIKQIKDIIRYNLKESGIHIFIPSPMVDEYTYKSIKVEDSHYFEVLLSEKKLTLEKQNLFFNNLQETLSRIKIQIDDDCMSIFMDSRTNYLSIGLNLPAGSF